MPELPTGIVTVLFTDIEGSTKLLQDLGERYAEALVEHRRRLREAFGRHGGVEVDTQGDAFFYVFADAEEAVAAAEEGQAALIDGPIRVRIGIHTGEPQRTGEGYVGIDVHRAARICSTAHGGQVVLSERTHSLLDATFSLTDLGLHRLKDLGRPEKLFQVGDGKFPPLRSLNATNLPAQPSPLVGRERELDEVQALVGRRRLVTLTGAGGSGKTRLGLQVAAELVDDFRDGVFWVPLAALTDPGLALPTIAMTIGAKDGVAEHIAEKRILLLLDNLEQILDCGLALAKVLEACPNLKLLATSRAVLRVSGEREYEVQPLPEHDAVELFRERAVQAEPAEAVEEICRRLDGLPLAIELAAARTRGLPPDKLLERLDRRLPLLTGGQRDAPARQRTLTATIAWSYDLLSPEEQQPFRRLSVFAGGFALEAGEEVCDADLDVLESLLEQSLLRRTEKGRFFYLETIREYALETLERSGEAEALRRRHADYFATLGASAGAGLESPDEARWLRRLDDELENVRAALAYGRARDRPLALRLASALWRFWIGRGLLREGRQWVEELLAAEPPNALRNNGLRALGILTLQLGDLEKTRALAEEGLALSRRLGDRAAEAGSLNHLAGVSLLAGDLTQAASLLEQAIAIGRAAGSKYVPRYLSNLALALTGLGDYDRAAELLEESIAAERQRGSGQRLSYSLGNFGNLLFYRGEIERSLAVLREGLELCRTYNRTDRDIYFSLIARNVAARGDPERAARLLGAADAVADEVGRGEPWRDSEIDDEIRAVLGSERFEAMLAEGRLLGEEKAVALASASVD